MNEQLEYIKRLKSIAETGLLYNRNEYDKERYEELLALSYEMLENITDTPIHQLKIQLPKANDYPTAKVDIRALVISNDQKILLTQESADGKWSLPGGWGDIGYTPTEIAIKECREETGLDVEVERLLAVFDKRMHPHPPQPFYVYKFVFLCRALNQTLIKGHDVLDVQYFPISELPPLSTDRILPTQIELAYNKAISNDCSVYVD